jgi:hypothetical protein
MNEDVDVGFLRVEVMRQYSRIKTGRSSETLVEYGRTALLLKANIANFTTVRILNLNGKNIWGGNFSVPKRRGESCIR